MGITKLGLLSVIIGGIIIDEYGIGADECGIGGFDIFYILFIFFILL